MRTVAKRILTLPVVAALTVSLVTALPAADGVASAAPVSIKASAKQVASGDQVKVRGTFRKAKARARVALQAKAPGSGWTNAGSKRLSKKKKVVFTPRPTLGVNRYRLVAEVGNGLRRSRAVKVTGLLRRSTTAPVLPGRTVRVSGVLPTPVKRTVRLQEKRGGSWADIGKRTTTAGGALAFDVRPAASMTVRVLAPKARVKKGKKKVRVKAFTSPASTIAVRTQTASVTTDPTLCVAQPASATFTSTPIGPNRPVQLQMAKGSAAWKVVGSATAAANGSATIKYNAPGEAGDYRARAVAAAGTGIPAVATAVRNVDVVACSGPSLPEPPVVAAGGDHTCALNMDGEVWCWGRNQHYQLGNSDTDPQVAPARVDAGPSVTFTNVAAGKTLSCAIDTTGAAWCWGTYSATSIDRDDDVVWSSPSRLGGSLKFTQLAVGQYHACGIATSSAVYCWGIVASGVLGVATKATDYSFSDAPRLIGFGYKQIVADGSTTCALTTGGQSKCWGGSAVVGEPDRLIGWPATTVSGSVNFAKISLGCGLTSSGSAYCWGTDFWGKLGNGPGGLYNQIEPMPVVGGRIYIDISEQSNGVCAIGTNGQSYCWGYGAYGQIGDGYTTSRESPTEAFFIGPTRTFKQISHGNLHTCAVRDEGISVYCWGSNLYGQLGRGSVGTVSSQPGIAQFS
jgi:alpha-tubulin suppressor-like RCC1 family protein